MERERFPSIMTAPLFIYQQHKLNVYYTIRDVHVNVSMFHVFLLVSKEAKLHFPSDVLRPF